MRQRWPAVPVAAAAQGGAASDLADVADAVCSKRSGAATMLLCDRCNRGYHTRCIVGTAGTRPLWTALLAVLVLPSTRRPLKRRTHVDLR
jgi:hypothetical protein